MRTASLSLPDYEGGSIVNLAASGLAAFGVRPGAAPLRPELLPAQGLAGDGGVVLLVIDALGRAQLETALDAGATPRLAELIEAAPRGLQQLTSVFPSTTTAALDSLATAAPPAAHGVLGHLLWFEALETIVNMLTLYPLGADDPIDEESLRRVPTVYQQLAAAGVPSALVTDAQFEGTPFTSLLQAGARFYGYEGLSQIPYQLGRALADADGQRQFTSLYWPLIDTLGHSHGPDLPGAASPACRAEMAFIDIMVDKVAQLCRQHACCLVVVADHGQTWVDPKRALRLDEPPIPALTGAPGGGRRVPYLHTGDVAAVRADPRLSAPGTQLVATDDAIAAGWFGGPLAADLRPRVGDLLAVSGSGLQLLWDYGRGTHPQRGSHGGLTPEEMIVPLIVVPAC